MNVDAESTGEGRRRKNEIFGKISPRLPEETGVDPEEIEIGWDRREWQRQDEKTKVREKKGKRQ
jgi:hypothetical protein